MERVRIVAVARSAEGIGRVLRHSGAEAVGSGDRGGDEADVGLVEVAQAAGEVDGDVVVGEAGSDPQDVVFGGGAAELAGVQGGDGLVPSDVGVGMSAGAGAGGDVVADEVGVGEPCLGGADQLAGGARGSQPAGVCDQRVRELVVGEGHRSPRLVVVSAVVAWWSGCFTPVSAVRCPSVPAVGAARKARTLPGPTAPAAAAARSRWISAYWAGRRGSARARWSCSAVMAWSWPAQRVFSAAFPAFSLAICASRGSGWPPAAAAAALSCSNCSFRCG